MTKKKKVSLKEKPRLNECGECDGEGSANGKDVCPVCNGKGKIKVK